jgi:hypothetical protein
MTGISVLAQAFWFVIIDAGNERNPDGVPGSSVPI